MTRNQAEVRRTEMKNAKTRPYRTFVLRCWKAGCNADDAAGEWRYVVQEAPGGEYRKASTSLGTLTAHLRVELERGAGES
jgi:hypothetical protein